MPNKFKSLKEVFDKEPGLRGIRNILNESKVISDFFLIFPEFRKAVIPEKIENKKLFLKVENPVWRNELKFKEPDLINKINTHFKREIVKWIKIIS